jgi:hypothetical protein
MLRLRGDQGTQLIPSAFAGVLRYARRLSLAARPRRLAEHFHSPALLPWPLVAPFVGVPGAFPRDAAGRMHVWSGQSWSSST